MSVVVQDCPSCHAPVVAGDLYCESCGADLQVSAAVGHPGSNGAADPAPADDVIAAGPAIPAGEVIAAGSAIPAGGVPAVGGGTAVRIDPPDLVRTSSRCAACGGDVAADGYCGQCGTPAPLPRDHWLEQPSPWVAAVCDRGVRHPHNEDAVAVAAAQAPGSFAALVVCDGVSSSTGSDVASLAAVRAARDVLVAAANPPPDRAGAGVESSTLAAAAVPQPARSPGASGGSDPGDDSATTADLDALETLDADRPTSGRAQARAGALSAAIVDAGLRANAAVVTTAGNPPGPNPPSCTFVCAVLEGRLLVAGWVGDSRAYWLPDAGPAVQVSTDDSWAGEAIAAGIPRRDAERAPQAHAITRWFGVDAPDPRAHTAAHLLDGGGWLLVCSDGLWNYCSPAAELQGLVGQTAGRTGPDPARLAEELVTWAKQQGGHDNITVALARVN